MAVGGWRLEVGGEKRETRDEGRGQRLEKKEDEKISWLGDKGQRSDADIQHPASSTKKRQ
jgi:hypothetical protein